MIISPIEKKFAGISHFIDSTLSILHKVKLFQEIFSLTTFYYQPKEKLNTVRVTEEPTSFTFLTDLNWDVHVAIIYR